MWIVDHGSCRFLFQPGSETLPGLPSDHLLPDRDDAFDSRWLEPLSPSDVARTLTLVPEVWLAETGLSRDLLAVKIEASLRLARPGSA